MPRHLKLKRFFLTFVAGGIVQSSVICLITRSFATLRRSRTRSHSSVSGVGVSDRIQGSSSRFK